MRKLTYADRLTKGERSWLHSVVTTGKHPARAIRRANIILLSDAGRSQGEICSLLRASETTVDRTRHRWIGEGVKVALVERSRSGRPRTLDERDEAKVVALACTPPPTGSRRWAHRALTTALHKQGLLSQEVSRETVRRIMARHELKPWKKGSTGASLN